MSLPRYLYRKPFPKFVPVPPSADDKKIKICAATMKKNKARFTSIKKGFHQIFTCHLRYIVGSRAMFRIDFIPLQYRVEQNQRIKWQNLFGFMLAFCVNPRIHFDDA